MTGGYWELIKNRGGGGERRGGGGGGKFYPLRVARW